MPSHAPAPVVPKPNEQSLFTGQFAVVTGTSSGSPTTLLTPQQLSPGQQYVRLAAALIAGQTAAVTLNIGFGGTGLGYEFDQLIFPLRGFQLVLDWKAVRGEINGPVVAWASTGSVIVLDVATLSRGS